VGEAAGA